MITLRNLGLEPYETIWEKMKEFTLNRQADTPDELWLLQHPPVYTQGQAGKPEHILNPGAIPIVQSDRGGQVTYHGPGQLVGYLLMDINRINLGVRSLVCALEKILIEVIQHYGAQAHCVEGAPGVYVENKKIASIGLRVKNGCTYHGIALNVNMDIKPFYGINPCGFAKMEMTQLSDFDPKVSIEKVSDQFTQAFMAYFAKLVEKVD